MKTGIIACRVIEKELNTILQEENIHYPVIWVEPTQHDTPKKLHAILEDDLNRIRVDRVIMTLGLCGNSIIGLKTEDREIILPKADDCITLLLGSHERRRELNMEMPAYYMTEGWLKGPKTPMTELENVFDLYGEEKGGKVIDTLYHNYQYLCLLDTGLSDMKKLEEECVAFAGETKMKICTVTGTLSWLKKLILGPWDTDQFIVKHPGEKITEADFLM